MEEIWKVIKGSDGLFSVSNLGRVRLNNYIYKSNKKNYTHEYKERIIEPFTWQSHYLRVDIRHRATGFRRATYIHTLVAEHFIGPRPKGMCIDHINGNYLDNRACNLRYCSQKENCLNNNTRIKFKKTIEERRKDPLKMQQLHDTISNTTKEGMKNMKNRERLGSGVRGKHKVWDNKELNQYHYE